MTDSRYRVVVLVVATTLFSGAAGGTSPVLDAELPVSSPNGKVIAAPGPKEQSTIVSRKVGPKAMEKLWEMPEWNHVSFISDDGEYLVRGHWGVNVLRPGYTPDEVMLSFYRRGALIKSIRLKEMMSDPKILHSNDQPLWGYYQGFMGLHRFVVDTMEQRRLIYDVTTGAVLEVIVPSPNPQVAPSLPSPAPPRLRRKRVR
jgi:hypothetical protein